MKEKNININKIALKILEEMQDLQLKRGENETYGQLLNYTKNAIKIVQEKRFPCDVNEIAETLSGSLLDSISVTNASYFASGMKAGASIIAELLI